MGAFLNSLHEEGTLLELAYWIGRNEAEYKAKGKEHEKVDYNAVITAKSKRTLMKELAKVSP
jgi:hypothetical protein